MAASKGRSDATEVFPFLYMGGLASRRDMDFIKEKKITVIINSSNMKLEEADKGIIEIFICLDDRAASDISHHFDSIGQRIAEKENSQEAVLVHCSAGISRSATLIIAYLMRHKNMSLKDAYDFLKSKRRVIDPNLGFWKQLVDYEHHIFGTNSVKMIECPAVMADDPEGQNTLMIPDIYKAAYEKLVM